MGKPAKVGRYVAALLYWFKKLRISFKCSSRFYIPLFAKYCLELYSELILYYFTFNIHFYIFQISNYCYYYFSTLKSLLNLILCSILLIATSSKLLDFNCIPFLLNRYLNISQVFHKFHLSLIPEKTLQLFNYETSTFSHDRDTFWATCLNGLSHQTALDAVLLQLPVIWCQKVQCNWLYFLWRWQFAINFVKWKNFYKFVKIKSPLGVPWPLHVELV